MNAKITVLNVLQRIGMALVSVGLAGLLVACGGGSDAPTAAPPPPAAAITAQPTDQSAVAGTSATFSVTATNASGYQWQRSSDGGATFADVAGATATSHTTAATTPADNAAQFRVVVSGAANSVTSSAARLTVTAAAVAPGITMQPAAQTITAGQSASFSVTAAGTALTYQWQHSMDGGTTFTDEADATAATFTLTAVAQLHNGHFLRVVVSNSLGSVTSTAALLTVIAVVPPGRLNDTGQTLCYDNTTIAACATIAADNGTLPRQDARFGRDAQAAAGTLVKIGAGAAGFDYTKVCFDGRLNCAGAASNASAPAAVEWACTKDNQTGLTWSLESTSGDWTTYATTTHPAAVNATARCGFSTGWRLPTRRELLSIVHNGVSNPTIDTGHFPGTVGNAYWSSDAGAVNPVNGPMVAAWTVQFVNGASSGAGKNSSQTVRLVRGTPSPAATYTDNGNGTVTDTATALMWDRCSQGQSGASCATGAIIFMPWSAALTAAVTANTANYKGFNDWRLPNKNEMESIVDITMFPQPTLNLTAFPAPPNAGQGQSLSYWSSTSIGAGSNAWSPSFFDGNFLGSFKSDNLPVRLVRGGQ